MKTKPLVSVIVSTYNSERFIRGRIEDLLRQTIADKLEIIIVNSGSQQDEDSIVKEYLNNYPNFRYIKTETRETIYKAWNRGIRIAEGEFITNANTDDRLKKDAYEVLSNFLISHKNIGLVYANQLITHIENQTFQEALQTKSEVFRFPDFSHVKLLERCIIGSQPMWRASLHFKNNLWFDEKFEVCGDHEFELKISEEHGIFHLPILTGTFYKSPAKSNKENENIERNLQEVEKIWDNYIPKFIDKLTEDELHYYKKYFMKYLLLPTPLYIMFRFIDQQVLPNMYPNYLFHSYEFMQKFFSILLRKIGDYKTLNKFEKKTAHYYKMMGLLRKMKRVIVNNA